MYWDGILDSLICKSSSSAEDKSFFYSPKVLESVSKLSKSLGYGTPIFSGSGSFSKVYRVSDTHVLLLNSEKSQFRNNKHARKFFPSLKVPEAYSITPISSGEIAVMDYIQGRTLWYSDVKVLRSNINNVANKICTIENYNLEGWGQINYSQNVGTHSELLDALSAHPFSCCCQGFICRKFGMVRVVKEAESYIMNYNWKRLKQMKTIVHGDYHLDNMMVFEGQISGVIDWSYMGLLPTFFDYVDLERNIPVTPYDAKILTDYIHNFFCEHYNESDVLQDLQACMIAHFLGKLAVKSHKENFENMQYINILKLLLSGSYKRWNRNFKP